MAEFDRRMLKIALDRYHSGLGEAARTLIIDYVRQYPGDEEGWLTLSHVLDDPAKKADCLRRALAINPNCQEAKSTLEEIVPGRPKPPAPTPPNPTTLEKPGEPIRANPIPAPEPIILGDPPSIVSQEESSVPNPHSVAAKKGTMAKTPPQKPPSSQSNSIIWMAAGCAGIAVVGVIATILFLLAGTPAIAIPTEAPIDTLPAPSPTVVYLPAKWTVTPTATISPTPTVTPTATPSPTATFPPPEPTAFAKMDKVMKQVEDLRGLTRKHDLPMYVIDNQQAESILQQLLDESGYRQTVDAEKRKLVVLGFIKPTYDLAYYSTTRLSDNIAGFYIPEQQVLYVIGNQFGGVEKDIFAHEFDHALVFQNLFNDTSPTAENPACQNDSQRCDAITALVEGDARWIEYQWQDQYMSEQDYYDFLRYRSPRTPISQEVHPPFAYFQTYFPYVQGMEFVKYLYDRGNWARVNKAYQALPASTEQILHPEKYIANETPVAVPSVDLKGTLGDQWKLESSDSLGEYLTYLLLAYSADVTTQVKSKADDAIALAGSAGWGGDRYQVYYRAADDSTLLVAHWIWDTTWDTTQFMTPMAKSLDNRFRGGKVSGAKGSCWTVNKQTTCLYSQGRHAVWVIAPDLDTVNLIFAQMDYSIS
jgi:hypothetical protein